jgi:hypothetical protein
MKGLVDNEGAEKAAIIYLQWTFTLGDLGDGCAF